MLCWNCHEGMVVRKDARDYPYWLCPKCGATANTTKLPEVKSPLVRSDKAAWNDWNRKKGWF